MERFASAALVAFVVAAVATAVAVVVAVRVSMHRRHGEHVIEFVGMWIFTGFNIAVIAYGLLTP